MPFPASLTLVTVNCQIDLPPDGGGSATVTFTRPLPLTGTSIVPAVPQILEIGSSGAGSVQLPATNDPQWLPQNWTYQVRLEVDGVSSFGTMTLDYQDAEVDFADVVDWNGTAVTGTTYATLAQLTTLDTEKLDVAGGTMTGDLIVSEALAQLRGPAGTFRQLQWATGASVRWSAYASNGAESGAGAGSDWRLVRYDDAGEALDAPISVSRATGGVTLGGPLTVAGTDFRLANAVVKPADHSLIGWTFDPAQIQAGTVLPTAGVAHVARVQALSSVLTNVHFHFTAGGSGLTGGYVAIYNDAGALIGASAVSADQAASWATSGYKTCALSVAQGVTPYAWYRIVWWFTGTTGPTLSRAGSVATAAANAGLSSGYRFATADTGLTTTAPANLAAQSAGATAWWVGLS